MKKSFLLAAAVAFGAVCAQADLVSIPGAIDVSPASYYEEPNDTNHPSISEITITYPVGTVVSAGPNLANNSFPVIVNGKTKADNVKNGTKTIADIANAYNVWSYTTTTFDGNNVTIKFDTPITGAFNVASYVKCVKIPAGVFNLTVGGVTTENALSAYVFRNNVPVLGKIRSGVNDLDPDRVYTIAELSGNSPAQTNGTAVPAETRLNYYDASEIMYAGTAKPYLKDAKGNNVLTFSVYCMNGQHEYALWATTTSMTEAIAPGVNTYTLVFPANSIRWTASGGQGILYDQEFSASIKIEGPKAALNPADYVKMESPATSDVSKNSYYGYEGMGFISLGLNNGVELNKECAAKASYSYRAAGEENAIVVTEVAANDESRVMVTSVGAFADDLIEFTPTNALFFLFDDGFYGGKATEPYNLGGEWILTIPDGYLKVDGEEIPASTFVYNYQPGSSSQLTDYSYTLEPAEDATDITNLKQIKVTFTGAKSFVDYKGNGGGSLTGPNGNIAQSQWPTGSYSKTLTYYYEKETEWANGTYTFAIKPEVICYDTYEDEADKGDFPGLTAIYKIDNVNSHVELVGIAGADNYTVVDLNGNLLLDKADADALLNLDKGIYIINGKKVVLRK
ncbi:MAG: hypothetical protein NC328_02250 [Muribaculum sp.]|nr:hypothetical protein [Muribaculum sp.]